MLTTAQLALYNEQGFLVLPGFVSAQACAALVRRAVELAEGLDAGAQRIVFETRRQSHGAQDYFLSSGGTIRFFFEEQALLPDGTLPDGRHEALNKIGHALHDLDPVFSAFSRTAALRQLAEDLGLCQPLLVQSMYIFKGAGVGGEVTCHQDGTYLFTEPLTTTGLWFALADADRGNGCLWTLPGGHRSGLRSRFVRERDAARTVVLDPTPWPEQGWVPLEVSAGTLVVLHGRAPHKSGANTSERGRPAYTLHLIDGRSVYPADNWLQRPPGMPPRGF